MGWSTPCLTNIHYIMSYTMYTGSLYGLRDPLLCICRAIIPWPRNMFSQKSLVHLGVPKESSPLFAPQKNVFKFLSFQRHLHPRSMGLSPAWGGVSCFPETDFSMACSRPIIGTPVSRIWIEVQPWGGTDFMETDSSNPLEGTPRKRVDRKEWLLILFFGFSVAFGCPPHMFQNIFHYF